MIWVAVSVSVVFVVLVGALARNDLPKRLLVFVAFAVVIVGGVLLLVTDPVARPAFGALALVWAAACAVDLERHQLPDAYTLPSYPLFLMALVPATVDDLAALLRVGLAGLAAMAVFYGIGLANPTQFGLGDVKLALTVGAALGWFGWWPWLVGLGAGFVIFAVLGAVLLASGRRDKASELAFGPFMVAGVLVGPWAASLLM